MKTVKRTRQTRQSVEERNLAAFRAIGKQIAEARRACEGLQPVASLLAQWSRAIVGGVSR